MCLRQKTYMARRMERMERVLTILSMGTCEKANVTAGGGLNVNRPLLAELAISGRLGSINRERPNGVHGGTDHAVKERFFLNPSLPIILSGNRARVSGGLLLRPRTGTVRRRVRGTRGA